MAPKPRKLASGRYQARYLPYKGATKYKTAPYTFRTRTEANKWLLVTEAKIALNEFVDPELGLKPFRTYADEWVGTRVLADSTRAAYEYRLRKYVYPHLEGDGWSPIGQMSAGDLRQWHRRLDHIKPTQATVYRLVRSILATAVEDGILKKNPCSIPNAGRHHADEREVALAVDIIRAALLMPVRERLWVILACWGGMRRGELAGLRRRQIDVANQTIQIGPTRVAVYGRFVDKKTGKTLRSKRPVVLPKTVMDLVVAHLDEHVGPEPDARVFTGIRDRSGPICVRSLYDHWHIARAGIGRSDLRMHDLRHSGSTILSIGGATVKERMAWGGWATAEMALRYDHATDPRAVENAERLDADLAGSNVVDLFRSDEPKRARRRPAAGES
jgi:integrase